MIILAVEEEREMKRQLENNVQTIETDFPKLDLNDKGVDDTQ